MNPNVHRVKFYSHYVVYLESLILIFRANKKHISQKKDYTIYNIKVKKIKSSNHLHRKEHETKYFL